MKKIAKYFFAAVAMTAAVSCVKELDTEVVKPVEMTGKAYVFSASFDAETKTVLDEETLVPMWFGDQDGNEFITVMEPGSVNTYVAEGIYEPTAEVTFVMAEDGGSGLKGKAAFAVSPAGAWSCFNTADSLGVTVTYPQSQIAYDQTYDPAARVAVAYNEDIEANPHFNFKNASALLKFNLAEGSDPVKSIKFYSLGGEPLAGQMTLMVKDSVSMIVPAKGASSWVEIRGMYDSELDCDVDYYIAVAPSVLKKGIGFQFNDREDVQTFTISKEINIERNKIYDLGSFLYEASNDNKWYLVGNVEDGEVNTFANVMFQAEGDNLVAKNVTLAKGQSFKVLNPGLGQALYVNSNKIATDTWVDLTEERSFAGVKAEGVYDIYVDFVDEIITGVAVVKAGADVPEYLTIEGMQYSWIDSEYGSPVKHVVIFDVDTMTEAQSYDDVMAEYPEEYKDPMMVGNWEEVAVYTNIVYEPIHATAGYVKSFTVSKDWRGNPIETYYILKYSNVTSQGVDVYSPATFYENGEEVPVTDENGDYVGGYYEEIYDDDWNVIGQEFVPATYQGFGIAVQMEDYWDQGISYEESFLPVSWSVEEGDIDIVYSVPSGNFVYQLYDYETETMSEFIIDFGTLEKGVLTIAENFAYKSLYISEEEMPYYRHWGAEGAWGDIESYQPEVPGNWLLTAKYTDLNIVPTGPTTGEITFKLGNDSYKMEYSNYMYANCIQLTSPEEFEDSSMGLGFDEPVYGMIPDPGYHCYSSLDIVDIAPVEEVKSENDTPDGAQWFFVWEDMMGAPACLDFGVSTPDMFALCYDLAAVYGEENLPAEMVGLYMQYMGWQYEIEATDETSGIISVTSVDHFGDLITTPIAEYTDYNGLTMVVTSDMLYLDNVTMVAGKTKPVYIEMGGGVM